jgi:hypothetical protein
MAPKLIYFGADTSHRLSVLRASGYVVDNCMSPSELIAALNSGAEILAVLCSDGDGETIVNAIDDGRAPCPAPLVVFSDSCSLCDGVGYDFIIPNLTAPTEWLQDIAALIGQRRRAASAGSQFAKVLPMENAPRRIVRMESAPDDHGESLAPPPDDPRQGHRNRFDRGYIV